jgi:hypothetical protein
VNRRKEELKVNGELKGGAVENCKTRRICSRDEYDLVT